MRLLLAVLGNVHVQAVFIACLAGVGLGLMLAHALQARRKHGDMGTSSNPR